MSTRFIDKYEVILLDQGRTFMFENDRFGHEEHYLLSYHELGGTNLTKQCLNEVMDGLVHHMMDLGHNPLKYDSFPLVSEALREIAVAAHLSPEDIPLIEELVARHELGLISQRHANTIHLLSNTHRLGVVSNIWGKKNAFERNLREAGIFDCFEQIIWSSDHGSIKPSSKLFHHALALFDIPTSKVLFVGDHPYRDIAAASTCGCSTVWVQNDKEEFPKNVVPPDLVITHLEDLLSIND
jgi:putative hydrolase of the HAD superfamily